MKIGRMNIVGPRWLGLPWREAMLGFDFDGDDEPGDPSGLHVVAFGWSLGIYWPMRRRVMASWSVGERFRLVRF